jgi:hypothetical protein
LFTKPSVENSDRLTVQGGRDVAVGVEGHGNGAVTQQILDNLRVDASLEQDRRSRVAQIVDSDPGQPRLGKVLAEGRIDSSRFERAP